MTRTNPYITLLSKYTPFTQMITVICVTMFFIPFHSSLMMQPC
jgi:hypothetical protein